MLEDFKQFIQQNNLFAKEHKLLLAWSGGKDSTCLFHLLIKAGFQFTAVHFNYQLRGEDSIADAEFVSKTAQEYDIPLISESFETEHEAQKLKLNIQETARFLRYNRLYEIKEEKGFDFILTAHTSDDHTETILLNLDRGTGIAGLHGIPLQNDAVIRPLLFAESEQILSFLHEHQLNYRHDKSNDTNKYKRNLFRHGIAAEWKKQNPEIHKRIRDTTQRVQEFESYNAELSDYLLENITLSKSGGLHIHTVPLLKMKHADQFLYSILEPYAVNREECRQVGIKIKDKQPGSIRSKVYTIYIERNELQLVKNQEFSELDIQIESLPYTYHSDSCKLILELTSKDSLGLKIKAICADFNKIQLPLRIRTWKEGDKMQPLGMKGHKNISDILTDKKIPHMERKECLVIENSDSQIVGLFPDLISEKFKYDDNTHTILLCKYN